MSSSSPTASLESMALHMPMYTMRCMIAFLVAPLAVPLLFQMAAYLLPPREYGSVGIELFVSTLVAYAGVFAVGAPIYGFLRAHGLTAWWVAPIAGFLAGATMWYVFLVLLGLFFRSSMADSLSYLGGPGISLVAIGFAGPVGAVVGAILWLIARPDRQPQ